MDLFSAKRSDAQRTRDIKSQVANALGLAEDATVLITELACEDEDCPDRETLFAVLEATQQRLQVKLNFGIAELSDDQVGKACEALIKMRSEQRPA